MPYDRIRAGLVTRMLLKQAKPVLRAIQGGSQDLSHARVEFQEREPFTSRVHNILYAAEDATDVGGKEISRFNLQMQFTPSPGMNLLQCTLHCFPDDLKVRSLLIWHACDFESASQVNRCHVGKLI